jgi:hypothetical protein
MTFLKCKNCIVKSCCSEVCEDFKKYSKKKYSITIGNNISLEQAKTAFGDFVEEEGIGEKDWILSKAGNSSIFMFTKKEGE